MTDAPLDRAAYKRQLRGWLSYAFARSFPPPPTSFIYAHLAEASAQRSLCGCLAHALPAHLPRAVRAGQRLPPTRPHRAVLEHRRGYGGAGRGQAAVCSQAGLGVD